MELLNVSETMAVNGGLLPSPKQVGEFVLAFGDIAMGFAEGCGDAIEEWAR